MVCGVLLMMIAPAVFGQVSGAAVNTENAAPANRAFCPAPPRPDPSVKAIADAIGASVVHGRAFNYISGTWETHGYMYRDYVIGFTNSRMPELADVVTYTGIYSIQLEVEHQLAQPAQLMDTCSLINEGKHGLFVLVNSSYPKGLVVLFDHASEQVRAAVAKHLPEALHFTVRKGLVGVAWHSAGRFDVPLHTVAKGGFREFMNRL